MDARRLRVNQYNPGARDANGEDQPVTGALIVADAERQTEKDGTSRDVPWMTILSVTASITGVLAFLGIANLDQLRHTLFRPPGIGLADPDALVPRAEPSA
jgi:hypothetical protein